VNVRPPVAQPSATAAAPPTTNRTVAALAAAQPVFAGWLLTVQVKAI
jgi:hypothetical protein